MRSIDEPHTGEAFYLENQARIEADHPGVAGFKSWCSSGNPDYLRKEFANLDHDWNPSVELPFSRSPVPSTPVADVGSGDALTVKKVGPTLEESAAERRKREVAIQRADAAANAKRVAEAARSDAEVQAKIRKFKEDLKRRGNAQ